MGFDPIGRIFSYDLIFLFENTDLSDSEKFPRDRMMFYDSSITSRLKQKTRKF